MLYMFDDLNKYKEAGHFVVTLKDSLNHVCNAPTDKSGIYLVYALRSGQVELIYIGRSGKIDGNGKMFIRKAGLGGIKDRIVNGHQFGKIPRRVSWPNQMKNENIEALEVYWYVTHDDTCSDCPRILEKKLLTNYLDLYGKLPKWNKEL